MRGTIPDRERASNIKNGGEIVERFPWISALNHRSGALYQQILVQQRPCKSKSPHLAAEAA
jgi:hypothetical protein